MYEQLNSLLIVFCRTISTRQLYFSDHPKVRKLSTEFLRQLQAFCDETQIKKLFIGIIGGNLVFEGRNLIGPSIVGRQLIRFAEKLHCGGISFSAETTEKELTEFLNLTIDLEEPTGSLKTSRQLLEEKDIQSIEIAQHYAGQAGPVSKEQQTAWHGQDTGGFIHSPTLIYQALFDAVAQAHGDVARGKDIDMDNTRSVSEYMLHFSRSQFADLMQHVNYPDFDSYTVGHSVRVAALAVFLAHSFGWKDEDLLAVGTAGLLHDIGKSNVSDEILYKPGELSEEEFDQIMKHPRIGAEILMSYKSTTPLDIAAAWGHHMRYDGKGYPPQPKWSSRHPTTSLIQICDAFEALTAVRPYKPILTPHMAYSIMLADRGAFHPALLASFIHTVGIYPPGNSVNMSNGTRGIVLTIGDRIDRPEIRVTHDARGGEIGRQDQYVINLASDKHRSLRVEGLVFST